LLYDEASIYNRKKIDIDMLEIKMTAVSKSESLLGIMFDQGEYEIKEKVWAPFTRIRLGIIFLTLDFMWYHKS